MTARKNQCNECAFRDGSPEKQNPEWWSQIILSCCHRTFYCHKTMFKVSGGEWDGSYDPNRKANGSPATMADHQVCAGFKEHFKDDEPKQ